MSGRLNSNAVGALALTLVLWAAVAPESPVADAAMRGDTDRVRVLLHEGADVNAAQGDGMTALHWAAERGDGALVEMLVAAGANLHAVTRLGEYTPLHLAAKGAHGAAVRSLLEAGADPSAATSTGGAVALHFAAEAGSDESVSALVEHGADIDAAEAMWAQTPLMFAAARGRTSTVRTLLELGADPAITARVMDLAEREQEDRADQQRQTEITDRIRAAAEGRPAAQGGRGSGGRGQRGGPPSAGGGRGEQPRGGGQGGRAAGGGRSGAAAGGEPAPTREEINQAQRDRRPTGRLSHAQLVGGYGGLTALLLAVRDGHAATAMALLDGGAEIDQVSAGDGTAPLLMATINGHFDLALELLERGADPNLGSDANATPLYTTLNTQWIPKSRHPQPADYMQQQVSYLDLMRALLDAGADVNARLEKQLWFTTYGDDYLRTDRTGATPFWRAAYALDIPAMRLLIEYGADPDVPTIYSGGGGRGRGPSGPDPSGLPPAEAGDPGAFPIHAASGIGYGEGYAANIHRTVPDGWLPAVRYLVEELGADVNVRDSNGYNAVHHAAARGDNELIEYLVSKGADVMAVARSGQTTVDMANGPVQRISPFPATIALLESLGAINNHNCVSC